MSKLKIVTDSTCDLPREIREEYDVKMVPLNVSVDGETFLDHVTISPKEYMNRLKTAEEIPKTSQPSIGSLVSMYDRLGEEGYEVLSIHLTGGMSGTYQAATMAAEITDTKVTVVDSKFISLALSFQVLEAAKLAKEDYSVQKILERLEEIRNHTYLYVVVDTLEYLVKGGRIGRAKGLIGSLLKIKPIATLIDGVLEPTAKARSYAQVVKTLVEKLENDLAGRAIKNIAIVHAEAQELSLKLKEAVLQVKKELKDIPIFETGSTISTHTGPGAIGFMYQAE